MKLFIDPSRSLLSIACLLLLRTTAWGQAPINPNYQTYIRTYTGECIHQMRRHKIPASIMMAQGLIETGAGSSRLARDGSNHFGIKCHRAWQGQRIYAGDDLRGEYFRKYRSAGDSCEDHSNFLKQPRYKVLYTYQITDYGAWARGLQQCGYATDKGCANILIKVIEQYELYELDRGRYPRWISGCPAPTYTPSEKDPEMKLVHEGYFSYGLLYILVNEGDSLESIAHEMDISLKHLADYNDMPVDFPLQTGDVVYLKRKNKRTTSDYPDHVAQVGESMHDVPQHYDIRLERLYHMSHLGYDYAPEEGDVLRLR